MTTTSLTVVDYIPDPVGRRLRADLTAPHLTHAEGSWTGYNTEPGYAAIIVTTASAMMSAISAAIGQSRIIECDWDGVSETSSGAVGFNASKLTANASVDWGYNRSATNILVRPKAGRSPRVRSTVGQSAPGALNGHVLLTGVSRIEFREISFDGCGINVTRNSTYPEITMAVFKRCTILNSRNTGIGAVQGLGARLLHVEGCLFDGCAFGIQHSAHFMRSWNNGFVRHYNQDIHAARSYVSAHQKTWYANVWISGAVVWALDAQSSAHLDFAQISTSQIEVHKGYKHLLEFNVFYADNGTNTSTQGLYGSDGEAQGYRCDHLVHNDVLAIGATWAVTAYDPSDDGTKVVTRNIVARVGSGFGYGGGAQFDAYPRIVGNKEGQPAGTGRMIVSENYFTQEVEDTGRVMEDGNRWDNIKLDPRRYASTASRPEMLLTGNGTWSTDVNGRTVYEDPAPASLSKDAARTALLDFFRPSAGWRGVGAGPVDPMSWPTDPASVLTGSVAWPPDRLRTLQWSVADAATGGAANITVSALDTDVTGLAVMVDGADPIALAEPLVGEHAVTGLTNFSHSVSLVASNANGSSGPSAPKLCIVTLGKGIFHFDEVAPERAGFATCSAIPNGWQWTNSNTGSRTLYWTVDGLMTSGKSYLFELDVEASSLVNAISARCASNTALTAIRGLNAAVTPSEVDVRESFQLTITAGSETDYIGLLFNATGSRTIKLTNLRLTPL